MSITLTQNTPISPMAQASDPVTAKAVLLKDRLVGALVDSNSGNLPSLIRQVSQLLVSNRGLAVSGLPGFFNILEMR